MRVAYDLARRILPNHTTRFSRKDFILPQLFACLVVREMLRLSYRKAEAFFRDSPDWKKLSSTQGYTDPEIVSNITTVFLRPAAYSQI